jgi:uncharacterized membrane protein
MAKRIRKPQPSARRGSPSATGEKLQNEALEASGRQVDRWVPWLFLGLSLVIGSLYALIVPPMQVPDEMMHFARAYSVSRGVCVASPDIDMPQSFEQLNSLFPHWLEKHRRISPADLRNALDIPLNDNLMAGKALERSLSGFINQNAYHCTPYIPEAIVLSVGRLASISPLALMYLCRLTNLLFYSGLVFLALRLMPEFRVALLCVALIPMALHQAASVSADSTVLAVSFLFTAYVFRLALSRESRPLGLREHAILTLLILFLVLSKTLICSVFLLLLIPRGRFSSNRARWLTLTAYLALAIAATLGWQNVNAPSNARLAQERELLFNVDTAANIRFLYQHPVEVALIFASCLEPQYLYEHLQQFVGRLGWLTIQLPDWLVLIYLALLLAAAMSQTRSRPLSGQTRLWLLLFAAAFYGNTLLYGFIGNVPKQFYDHPDFWPQYRVALQGRYLLPFALPVLLICSTRRTWISPRYFLVAATAIVLLASGVALYLVRLKYYF